MNDAKAITLALETLEEYREGIDEVTADLMGRSTTLEERALIGDTLDRLRLTVTAASAWGNDRLVAAMNARRLDRLTDVPGLVPIERQPSKARKGWDNEALRTTTLGRLRTRAAEQARLVDPETGEPAPSWDDAVQSLTEVWNLSGANARITALKALGLDPDEYCTPGKTTWSVRYVRDDA